jgi:hypothetical protein
MKSLPRVGNVMRERLAREFDDRGPDVCRAEIIADLEANNPELLDIATRCARDVGDFTRVMTGFCMFYRLLNAEAQGARVALRAPGSDRQSSPLPRVTEDTRADIVRRIDSIGSQAFTREAIADLESNNPELLLMAHHFAADQTDYAGVMQGFALLYACLSAEGGRQHAVLH